VATISDVQMNIQRMLQSLFGTVQLDGDGDFVFRAESTLAFGEVLDWGDGDFVFNVWAPVLVDVPITNELCRYVATESFVLGNLRLAEQEDGKTAELQFQYRIIANDIDESELKHAVSAVVLVADDLDDKLVKRFGGQLALSD